MGARWAVAALLAAGCGAGATDPCSGHAGACLSVHVVGAGAVTQVDQVEVQLSGAVAFVGRTPSTPGDALDLPVAAAVFLPSAKGRLDVAVTGFLRDGAVGRGAAFTELVVDGHPQVTVVLNADHGLFDLAVADRADAAVAPDAAADAGATDGGADLATPDLALRDLTMPDLAMPDLTMPDLAMPVPRLLFTLPARNGNLGTLLSLDQACTTAASAPGFVLKWPKHQGKYAAIITYPNAPAPVQRIPLNQNRPIVRYDGMQVATDATIWKGALQSPPALDLNGQPSATCAWTNTLPDGTAAGHPNCLGWATTLLATGGTGNPTRVTGLWLDSGTTACTTGCAVYCIEL